MNVEFSPNELAPADAVAESRRHGQCVTIRAACHADADLIRAELERQARDGEATDYADAGDVIDVWCWDASTDDDSTEWRVNVVYGSEDAGQEDAP